MTVLEDLQASIRGGHAVVIVGTGLTMSTTYGAPTASWLGLVADGLRFLRERGQTGRWIDLADQQLLVAQEENDGDLLLAVASQVGNQVKKLGLQAFANWLADSVGSLEVATTTWADAVLTLGAPTFTTNYDTLLEKIGSRQSESWQDPRGFQKILAGSGGIGHLHGVYTDPDSVILSEADYQRLRLSDAPQALQRGISSTKSIVYIGCGGTLEDPNFSSLLDWHRDMFPVSGVDHYRLCLEAELPGLRASHANDNIKPVSYGTDFADLPAFLRRLAPGDDVQRTDAGVVQDAVGMAREYLLDQLRAQTIIAENQIDLDEKDLDQILIPPVLLPLPHDEFRRKSESAQQTRVDPYEVAKSNGVVLLVADENAGLSTALSWMLDQAARLRAHSAPLKLDFRQFQTGVGPLKRQVRLEAFHRGLLPDRKMEPPAVILAIDNFHGHSKTSSRTIDDLRSHDGPVFLGTRSDFEAETVDALRAADIACDVHYIGRLGRRDVLAMANLASPSKADELAKSVLTTIRTEHLPRTPFTVALLVAIMMRGETLVANASPTGVLDQYVAHLLGREDADQDSRFQLTSTDRESIVTDLASLFVEQDQGSLLQSESVARMEAFFSRFGWAESPTEVLNDLVLRRILVFEENQVRFTQSSFLHLFAAKALAKKPERLEAMYPRPLYYAPVLRAYASLVRHDSEMLRRLSEILDFDAHASFLDSAFREVASRDAPADLESRIDDGAVLNPEQSDDSQQPASSDSSDADPDMFDLMEDRDPLPFPLTSDEDLPLVTRQVQSADLVSAVLRDSEEVDDLDLKTDVLNKVLSLWGYLIDALDEDAQFRELVAGLREQVTREIDEPELLTALDEFLTVLPAAVVMSSVSMSLASRKLIVILKRLLSEPRFRENASASLVASLLVIAIRDPGWEELFKTTIVGIKRTWIAQKFLTLVIGMNYDNAAAGSSEERQLRALLADLNLATYKFTSASHEKAVRAKLEQTFQANKVLRLRQTPPKELDAE